MLDPNPDTRAKAIAPLLARMDRKSAPRREKSQWHYDYEERAKEYERRARDYEERVARGEPGREEWLQGAEVWREQAAQIRERFHREVNRHARRAAKHAARAARRAERRAARRDCPWRTPWPWSLFVTLAFTAGMIGIRVGMGIVAPLVLTILSGFFARRALLQTARELRSGADDAIEGMRHGLAIMRGEVVPKGTEDERIRVEEVGTRVADADADADAHADAHADADADTRADARRSRRA